MLVRPHKCVFLLSGLLLTMLVCPQRLPHIAKCVFLLAGFQIWKTFLTLNYVGMPPKTLHISVFFC